MTYSYFGIGTGLIGKRDFGIDGSFVTTEFRIVILPVYPIRSVRVIEGETTTEVHIFSSTDLTEYTVLAQGRVNIRQAVSVYSYAALHIAYCVTLAFIGPKWLLERYSFLDLRWILSFAMFALPAVIPMSLRRIAERRATASVIKLCPCGSGSPYETCCFARTGTLRDRERHSYKSFT
jgi:hypothetical protein